MIRIVTDLHHSVLYESLAMLFVDRAILGEAELIVWADGFYAMSGPQAEEFGRTPMAYRDIESADIVISTVGGTRDRMRSLAERTGALYVDHIGNAWDQPIGDTVLWAVTNDGESGVTYHPEFHRVPWVPPTGNTIGAFHASFSGLPCATLWADAQQKHPEYRFVQYGTPDALLRPHEVAQARSDCIAIWHCKDADGYGFGVHEAFASGRAVIGHRSHYKGKIAEPLFVQGVTYLEPGDSLMVRDRLREVGIGSRTAFRTLVDFDREAEMVAEYLGSRL